MLQNFDNYIEIQTKMNYMVDLHGILIPVMYGGFFMKVYNKLVRDHIPDIIKKDGKLPTTKILSDEEYKVELQKKAQEELNEYLQAASNKESIEELADLLEVIHSLCAVHGYSLEDLEEIRQQKATDRGAFKEKILLVEVTDPSYYTC